MTLFVLQMVNLGTTGPILGFYVGLLLLFMLNPNVANKMKCRGVKQSDQ